MKTLMLITDWVAEVGLLSVDNAYIFASVFAAFIGLLVAVSLAIIIRNSL